MTEKLNDRPVRVLNEDVGRAVAPPQSGSPVDSRASEETRRDFVRARFRRRAFSLVEILIASIVLLGGLVPMYILFTGSSKSIFRSRVSYMALHAAREELEALRQVQPAKLILMRHDWEPVTGTILRRVTPPGEGTAPAPGTPPAPGAPGAPGAPTALAYPAEYSRIETKVSISSSTDVDPVIGGPANPRLYRVLLEVRWQETGKAEDEGGAGHRTALSRFNTVIGDHRTK